MPIPRSASVSGLLVVLLGVQLTACSAEEASVAAPPVDPLLSTAPEVAAAARLRVAFPTHAPQLLDCSRAFLASSDGFAVPERAGAQRDGGAISVRLPTRGEDAIAMRAGDLAISVREIGASGEGVIAGSAVMYLREGGAALWAATPEGFEEWIHLDASSDRGERIAGTWAIDGASVQKAGEGAAIVDAAGIARIRVTAPVAYARSGHAVPVRLEITGARITVMVEAADEEVLVDPLWTSTGTMAHARYYHTTTRLPDGKVLVVGGDDPTNTTTELYDPASNTWSLAAAPLGNHAEHTATLLPGGKVVLYGGNVVQGGKASTEAYDPVSNTWTYLGQEDRYAHTATLLPTGKILVVGGVTALDGSSKSNMLYDPVANTWASAAPSLAGRFNHAATLLPSGEVLVTGGKGNLTLLASAERYNPASNAWSPAGSMPSAREDHTSTLLMSGDVVVAGGYASAGGASTALYNPVSGAWSPAGSLTTTRDRGTATRLASGDLLVAGGYGPTAPLASVDLYSAGNASGAPCGAGSECSSGLCVDGVCCTTACNGGACDACSIAAGATVDGTCQLLTGPICNDGDACTQSDTCQSGICSGSNLVTCAALDECHDAGMCAPGSGQCSNPPSADGSPCSGGTCTSGVCVSTASSSSSGTSVSSSSGVGGGTSGSSSAGVGGGTSASSSAGVGGGTSASSSVSAGVGTSVSSGAGLGGGGASASSGVGVGGSPGSNDVTTTSDSCSQAAGGSSGAVPAWLALGLLLLRQRRPRRTSAPST